MPTHIEVRRRRWLVPTLLLLVGAVGVSPASAPQRPGPSLFPPGALIDKTASIADPSQHYAIFVPSSYDPNDIWPVIFLMDPRGRALVPMERFRALDEQRGYILVSSYDTRSDVDFDPNTRALRAMVTDVDTFLSVDDSRFYLGGLSGTARSAWFHARFLRGSVAGVISFGAGGLPGEPPSDNDSFAFFGAAGITDFNYEELRTLAADLQRGRIPARLTVFDGGHQWGPLEVCAEAVDWMEIQAMRTGLKSPDAAIIDEIHDRWLAHALSLAASFGPLESFFAYRDITVGFAGLRETSEARARATALAESTEVQAALMRATDLSNEHREHLARLSKILDSLRDGSRPMRLEPILAELGVAQLLAAASAQPPNADTLAARRRLEAIFVNASFYEARAYLQQDRTAEALTMFQLASAIKPDDPRVLMGMASVHARNGFRQAAVETLARAADAAREGPSLLEDPFFFEPISGEPLIAPRRR
jgi:hypothetical protein